MNHTGMDDTGMDHPGGHHPGPDHLSALAEGLPLDAELQEALEQHLEACDACRREVAWIRELRGEAGAWALREVPPPPTLWTRIEAEISGSARSRGGARTGGRPGDGVEEERRGGILEIGPERRRRGGAGGGGRSWFRPGLQAAAAVALVAVSAFLGLHLLRTGEVVPGAGSDPGSGPAMAGELPTGTDDVRFAALVEEMEGAYGPAIRELERSLEEDRGNLAPETVEILEENLRIIDQAIRDALEALAADPGSSLAPSLLGGMYESKLQVLQQAVRLARSA
jgi:hypothetical protein